ncbi:MAG: SDR family NAD(P)-dependent oxidoreductase [Anaerolineae bacterium]
MIDTGLQDKVALITGANHGIGWATALALADQGVAVVVHYLAAQDAPADYQPQHMVKGPAATEALVREIAARGGRVAAIEGDLADPATIPLLFDRCEATLGPVDVLVNNAAHAEMPDTVLSITHKTIDRTFAVNTRAPVLLTAEFARRLQRRGGTWGRIINLSTDAAQAFVGQIAYGASKAATEASTRSLAIELAPLGVTVNTVAPGPVQTGWMSEELVARLTLEIPQGRVGTPEDIADTIVFLASEQARWLTGQVIKVSGGHGL